MRLRNEIRPPSSAATNANPAINATYIQFTADRSIGIAYSPKYHLVPSYPRPPRSATPWRRFAQKDIRLPQPAGDMDQVHGADAAPIASGVPPSYMIDLPALPMCLFCSA